MFKTLLKQIGDYKKDAILTPLFVFMEVIMEVIIPIMMAAIIDYGLADQSMGRVVLIGLAMIGAAMLALWFGVESGRTASSASSGFAMNLRQVISQSMPQMLSAVITIVGVFVSMLVLSRPLTLITIVMVISMVFATKTISSKSGYYFVKQQTDVGNLNGYIEEMMEGQKVVKVFCHEDACIQDFRALNGKLQGSANNANRYASILMPVLGNLGYVSYAVIAMVGACLSIFGGQDRKSVV